MSSHCILILGGSRSGKSDFAQRLAGDLGTKILFVATAVAGDDEMARRIAAHRKNRPKRWSTLEATQNVGKKIEMAPQADVVLIDCLTLLVSNLIVRQGKKPADRKVPSGSGTTPSTIYPIVRQGKEDDIDDRKAARRVNRELAALLNCFDRVNATFILVSNEVGMGLVPPYPLGRVYRDLLGEVNQRIAGRADQVYLMTAGIPVRLK